MNDLIDVEGMINTFDKEAKKNGLANLEELKETKIKCKIILGESEDVDKEIVVGYFQFYKNNALFKKLEAKTIEKHEGISYQERINRIINSIENLIKIKGFTIIRSDNDSVIDDDTIDQVT